MTFEPVGRGRDYYRVTYDYHLLGFVWMEDAEDCSRLAGGWSASPPRGRAHRSTAKGFPNRDAAAAYLGRLREKSTAHRLHPPTSRTP